MSDLQFPPSSPVLDGPNQYGDPFKGKEFARGKVEYPTPIPSSTLGRSSSPARYEVDFASPSEEGLSKNGDFVNGLTGDDERSFLKMVHYSEPTPGNNQVLGRPITLQAISQAISKPISVNRDFNIVNPHASVLRVPLLSNRTDLTIGRSSQACDFHFKNSIKKLDKRISRCHVKIKYSRDTMTITCLGFNGLGMLIPHVCLVKKTSDSVFELCETKTPLSCETVSKSIRLDHEHTEFYVSRGETVQMPRFANVLLQIATHILLVNPDDFDDEATDEEVEITSEAKFEKEDLKENRFYDTPMKLTKTANMVTKVLPRSNFTPETSQASPPQTPQKVACSLSLEEPTPSKPYKAVGNIENGSNRTSNLMRKSKSPLWSRPVNVPDTSLIRRKSKSEDPQGCVKKKKRVQKYDLNGKLIINEQCLEGVRNIGEIENILVNHLAFSRLSSTPASFLNTISARVAKVSLEQLRAVLNKISCIGVIYRRGNDAAGKPLEEEYYYVPENDRDPERNRLVSAVKGHGGLRACRKTHKQYYWKKPAPIKK